jgi:sugar lactone lactonase YvrE
MKQLSDVRTPGRSAATNTLARLTSYFLFAVAITGAAAVPCIAANITPVATASGDITGLTLDSSGNLWITTGDSVQRFSSSNYSGTVTTFNNAAFSQGSFPTGLYGIAVDSSGNVFVSNGGYVAYVDEFKPATLPSVTVDGDGTWTYFHNPNGLAIAPNGNVVVADTGSCRVDVFDPGAFASSFQAYGTCGSGSGNIQNPATVAVGANGDIFVADSANNRIVQFNPSNFLTTFTTFAITNPTGVALDADGNVYVANGTLWKFNPANFSGSLTQLTSSAANLVALDATGNVFFSSGSQINEISAATPEPGAWLLMLTGVGAVGLSRSKRKNRA